MKDLYHPQLDPELYVAGKTLPLIKRVCSCGAIIKDSHHPERIDVVPNGCAACQKK